MHQRSRRHRQIIHHAAVDMYPADLDHCAAVRFTVTAGNAGPAMKIGDYRDRLPGHKARRTVNIHQVPGELVTQDARITEIRLCTFEGMQVGAANPDPPDPDNRLTRTCDRRRHLPVFHRPWPYTN